jgi:hypothetical protein
MEDTLHTQSVEPLDLGDDESPLELIERLEAVEMAFYFACHHPLTYDMVED